MSDLSDSEPLGSLRVFVVENHADTLKWIVLYLEAVGHSVASAKTVREAVERLPQAPYDVLISDIGLPDGDGWDLLQRVRLTHPIYAVAMSGFGLNSDQAKSKKAGFRHHLIKPFNPDELDAVLEEAAREAVVGR